MNVIEDEEGWVYEYDAENKIIRAERGGEEIRYVYNGEGERVKKIKGGEEIRYLIDKENPTGYSQVIEERGSGGEVKRRYVYGYDLISMTDVSTNKTYYYVYDGIGSVRCVLDEGGNIVNEYDYDGFGIILNERETITNAYKFHGEYKDEDTGLYYLRARWYDVDTGRFYSMDEFEGVYEDLSSLHKYVFAGNDGVNRVDYSGMMYVGGGVVGVRMSEVMGERVRELLGGKIFKVDTVIYFITISGFSAKGTTGMDILWEKARVNFTLFVFKGGSYKETEEDKMLEDFALYKRRTKKEIKIFVAGHSRGAVKAVKFCKKLLNKKIKIKGLYSIDMIKLPGVEEWARKIPGNVLNFGNVYQRNEKVKFLRGEKHFVLTSKTYKQFNEEMINDTHTTIDNSSLTHMLIIGGMEEAINE